MLDVPGVRGVDFPKDPPPDNHHRLEEGHRRGPAGPTELCPGQWVGETCDHVGCICNDLLDSWYATYLSNVCGLEVCHSPQTIFRIVKFSTGIGQE